MAFALFSFILILFVTEILFFVEVHRSWSFWLDLILSKKIVHIIIFRIIKVFSTLLTFFIIFLSSYLWCNPTLECWIIILFNKSVKLFLCWYQFDLLFTFPFFEIFPNFISKFLSFFTTELFIHFVNSGDFILYLLKGHLNWVQIILTQIHFSSHAKSPDLVIMLTNLGIDHSLQLELPLNSWYDDLVLRNTTEYEVCKSHGKAYHDYN